MTIHDVGGPTMHDPTVHLGEPAPVLPTEPRPITRVAFWVYVTAALVLAGLLLTAVARSAS